MTGAGLLPRLMNGTCKDAGPDRGELLADASGLAHQIRLREPADKPAR
jgi:hypothetical protein